jgi:hypothetical protein
MQLFAVVFAARSVAILLKFKVLKMVIVEVNSRSDH